MSSRWQRGHRAGVLGRALAIASMTLCVASVARAQTSTDMLSQGAPSPFTAPGGLFALNVPYGWVVAKVDNDPNAIEFRAQTLEGYGTLTVRRVRVPSGANPRQLLLNALETRLKKLPSFRMLQRRDVSIAGNPASSITGSYAYQGNLQFPRLVEEIHLVAGTDGFVFHFECFQPTGELYIGDLQTFYTSFQPRPVATGQGPFAVPPEPYGADPKIPNPDSVPF